MNNHYEIADTLLTVYEDRNQQNEHMDDIYYGRWNLPDGMPKWVQKVQVMDGHDAVQTSARVLSQYNLVRTKVQPMLPDEANKLRAEQIKVALKWNLASSMKRNDGNILHELAFSAVQYSSPVVQVVYLPYQEKVLKAMGKDTNRIKRLRKNGDFMFISHHASNVYPLYSMYGLESLLVVKVQLAKQFKAEWGELAKDVVTKDDENKELWITSYDLWSNERRQVWGVSSLNDTITENSLVGSGKVQGIDILDDENELGFIPFAVRRWGNKTSGKSSEWYNPMLKTMYDSGQWDMLNIYASLDGTLAWKRAAQPVGVHQSSTGQKIKMDYTEPAGIIETGPNSTFTPLPPGSVDQRVRSNLESLRASIWQSTVARSLQSLEFPSGTASSSINQVISAATSSLAPYKTIMEQCIGDMFYIMLCYIRYYGEKFERANLYGEDKDGASVIIPWDTIDPDELRFEIIITPDVPLDRQAQINSATLLYRDFGMPQDELLEEIGYDNVSELWKRRKQEDLNNATIEVEVQRMIKELELEYATKTQQMMMGIQQQANEAAMAAQGGEQQPPAPGQGMTESGNEAASPITENTGGLGGNPAMSGTPPVQQAPGQVS